MVAFSGVIPVKHLTRHHPANGLDLPGLWRELRCTVEGEVRFDDGARALYAHDASSYRQVPLGVVGPITERICRSIAAASMAARRPSPTSSSAPLARPHPTLLISALSLQGLRDLRGERGKAHVLFEHDDAKVLYHGGSGLRGARLRDALVYLRERARRHDVRDRSLQLVLPARDTSPSLFIIASKPICAISAAIMSARSKKSVSVAPGMRHVTLTPVSSSS